MINIGIIGSNFITDRLIEELERLMMLILLLSIQELKKELKNLLTSMELKIYIQV